MTSMAPLLLTLGPLAGYFALQGVWSCSGRPRVVAGTIDYLLMAFGLGTLLAYGPVGSFLLGAIFGTPGAYAQLAWLSFLTTVSLAFAGPAHRWLLVYNVDPARAHAAVREALAHLPGEYVATIHGFEDRAVGRGVTLKTSRRFRSAEVEAFGRHADELIHALVGPLRDRLASDRRRPAWRVAAFWCVLAALTLGGPIAWRAAHLPPTGPTVPAREAPRTDPARDAR